MERLLPSLDEATDNTVRAALRTLAARSSDADTRDLIDDVLAGRRSIRDALVAPGLQTVLAAGVARARAGWEELTPQERAGLHTERR